MEITQLFTVQNILMFVLIVTRVSGMIVAAPFFSDQGVPNHIKVGLALAMSLLLFPFYAGAGKTAPMPEDLIAFTLIAVQELAIGLMLGFAAMLAVTGLRMAGEHIAVHMGIAIASALDPATREQSTVFSQMMFFFGMLVFLSLNIHHGLIAAMDRSFQLIPLGHPFAALNHALAGRFTAMAGEMFVIGLMVAMPVMAILMVTEVALGFVNKVMPQMNIFIVGLPLKVAVGLMVIMISLPSAAKYLGNQYATLIEHALGLFKV